MKIVEQSYKIMDPIDGEAVLSKLERCGRTCYQSRDKMSEFSARDFVKRVIDLGHHSVLEHVSVTVDIVTSRNITHELVRHRLASYCQQSTRYCKEDDLYFIMPACKDTEQEQVVMEIFKRAEQVYHFLINNGVQRQHARDVVPGAWATEICVTANLREWRHIFEMRCDPKAHPDIRELMRNILFGLHLHIPVVFDDLAEKYLTHKKDG